MVGGGEDVQGAIRVSIQFTPKGQLPKNIDTDSVRYKEISSIKPPLQTSAEPDLFSARCCPVTSPLERAAD